MESLSQNEMLRSSSRTFLQRSHVQRQRRPKPQLWPVICSFCTCLIPNFMLSLFGMKTRSVQNAWREKYTLCVMIFLSCCLLAFLTYGMNLIVCRSSDQYVFSNLHRAKFKKPYIIANGQINYISSESNIEAKSWRRNMSHCVPKKVGSCKRRFGEGVCGSGAFKLPEEDLIPIGPMHYTWEDVWKLRMIVVNGKVYDPSHNTESYYDRFIQERRGLDGTEAFKKMGSDEQDCFKGTFYAGEISTKSTGCLVADFMLYLSTVAIFGLIISRFLLAAFYSLYIRMKMWRLRTPLSTPTLCLVTCYSEGRDGLKSTLDSLSEQDYGHKLIVVIADGMIKGSDNDKTTPEILLDLIEVDETLPIVPQDYIALAKGTNRHNRARVYPGHYKTEKSRTKVLLIVKCGNDEEKAKQGNRGKRDSQVILISFYSKLLYDDRFSSLDYDIYRKIKRLTGIDPGTFELILMVDADTIVKSNALTKFVSVFEADPKVMGMCGETKILNKCQSWVTMIQVFEYYISHHLTKSFESVFGGVTCLPGCFCMYRIYSNHIVNEHRAITPILANAFIVNAYSVFETNTLHQKNLLLLGEDRYLTTILLKNFYRRKLVFIPSAQCETFVPSSFRILLSQRRRWINSTIHNLFELVMVDKLCGTFCCSMQFVVMMELFGTLVLPAAIIFTGILIASSIIIKPEWIPLVMLAGILGLPAILIFLTTWEICYIFWLFIYILSLPIWNFVLPVYSFWHFDDFSWGETRKIQGEDTAHGDGEGEFDISKISLKHLSKLQEE